MSSAASPTTPPAASPNSSPGTGDPKLSTPPPPETRTGRGLRRMVTHHRATTVQYCNRNACRGCELKPQCTADTYRRVGRWTEEAVLDRMEARLAARPEILKQRREIAEHPFGSIKQWMNQGTFLLRGLEKVRAEFSLTALAYNFIRVVNIVGVASLLKAV